LHIVTEIQGKPQQCLFSALMGIKSGYNYRSKCYD
jgi:hypothetical protein